MKILVSALACHPRLGSESYVGWAAVQCLARDHELWVLTGARNRDDLEKLRAAGELRDNIHFVYAGRFKPWHPNRLRAHLQGWRDYLDFSNNILPVARELHQSVRFDIAHHLTLTSWRVPSPLWKLGVPFVFGPVGGNEQLPSKFLSILSWTAAGFELARKVSNASSRLMPGVRKCVRHAAHVFAANAETEDLLVRIRGSNAGVSRLLSYFHSGAGANAISDKNWDGPLRLLAAGSLDGRKGVALALQALAKAKSKGLRFRYRFDGEGPESAHIEQLAARLGLASEVVLGHSPRQEYEAEIRSAHIYLLPSLRDSAGISLAEAMLAGCVPVVADCGGPGELVSADSGYKAQPTNPGAVVDQITEILLRLDASRDLLKQKSLVAANRIAQNFSEEHYRQVVNSVYRNILTADRR